MTQTPLPELFPLSFCPTGMVPTRRDTPHVPLTPDEIAEQVREAAQIGITSVHLHARDADGAPTWRREVFEQIIERIKKFDDELVICVTTSGRNISDIELRAEVLQIDGDLKPDMASLTLASMNFATSASVNSPQTVRELARRMLDRGITPELEVFDTGMLNVVAYLAGQGVLAPPYVVNLLLGGLATVQASPLELGLLLERLPARATWLAAGIGAAQPAATALALASGGGVRVGLEDNIYLNRDRTMLARNVELVERTVAMGALLGRRVMTPAEFRLQVLS
jgi:uncharacterized protein (DUF849 family)